ncbi:MAG TPA: hypothetical protein VE046_10395 [Steroidobacteraceae bacterium]|nr:hypothetical protein [Steroidobacteraceae bacterium]
MLDELHDFDIVQVGKSVAAMTPGLSARETCERAFATLLQIGSGPMGGRK